MTKRPTAAEIVLELKLIYAELSAKARRRPSYEAAVATPGGGGFLRGRRNSRRHSWTQTSSDPTSRVDLTRLLSTSENASGTVNCSATDDKNGTTALFAAGEKPPLTVFSSSPGPVNHHDHRGNSLPMPLHAAPASSISASAKRRFFMRKRTSSKPIRTEDVVSSALGVKNNGKEEGDVIDHAAEGRAPGWTPNTAAGATATADGGGGGGGGSAGGGGGCLRDGTHACPLCRTLTGQREIIADALVREMEGSLSSRETSKTLRPRTTVAATTTKARVETQTERRGGQNGPSQNIGMLTFDDFEADSRAKMAVKTHLALSDVPDGPREVRRNSSLAKLWPSGSSTGGSAERSTAATRAIAVPAAVAQDAGVENITQMITSRMASKNCDSVQELNVANDAVGLTE